MKKPAPYPVRCRDNQGREIILPSTMTIAEMVAVGMNIGLKPKGEPLPDNHFRAIDPKAK